MAKNEESKYLYMLLCFSCYSKNMSHTKNVRILKIVAFYSLTYKIFSSSLVLCWLAPLWRNGVQDPEIMFGPRIRVAINRRFLLYLAIGFSSRAFFLPLVTTTMVSGIQTGARLQNIGKLTWKPHLHVGSLAPKTGTHVCCPSHLSTYA